MVCTRYNVTFIECCRSSVTEQEVIVLYHTYCSSAISTSPSTCMACREKGEGRDENVACCIKGTGEVRKGTGEVRKGTGREIKDKANQRIRGVGENKR